MRPFHRLASLLIFALLLAACASPTALAPTTAPASATTVPAAAAATALAPTVVPANTAAPTQPVAAHDQGLFFARPDGGAGPLLAYDLSTGSVRFNLPAGRLSADGKHFFSAAKDGTATQLTGYDLATGAPNLQSRLDGQWALGAVSSDGRWAALSRVYPDAQKEQWTDSTYQSEMQVIDGRTGKLAQAVSLNGNFEIDGLSTLGDSLYLIQYLPAVKSDHYEVRAYDRYAKSLVDGALVQKGAESEVMVGDRWDAVGSPDGEWLFTLYLRTKEGTAFIHALNLANRFTMCIDLPFKADNMEQLKYSTLALAPKGSTLYAANAALGVVAHVSLDDFNVLRSAQFQPVNPTIAYNPLPQSMSVVAPGGRALYFTNGAQAWAYDDQKDAVRPFGAPGPITGLGVNPDGTRVFMARPGQPLLVLDAASGSMLGFSDGVTALR
jgi:hypothetical protein